MADKCKFDPKTEVEQFIENGDERDGVRVVGNSMLDLNNGFIASAIDSINQLVDRASEFVNQTWTKAAVSDNKKIASIPKGILNVFSRRGKYAGREDLWTLDQERKRIINVYQKRGEFVSKRIRQAINEKFGKEPTNEDVEQVDRLIRDPNLRSGDPVFWDNGSPVEPYMRDALSEARGIITELSGLLKDSGILDGPLSAIVSGNMEMYITRIYEVHLDEDWMDTIKDTPEFEIARQHIDKQLAQKEDILLGQQLLAEHYQGIAEQRFEDAEFDVERDSAAKTIVFWTDKASEHAVRLAETKSRRNDLTAQVRAIIKTQTKGGDSGVGRKGKLGAKDEGVLSERGGSIRGKAREGTLKARRATEVRITKLIRKGKILQKAITQKASEKRPVNLGVRDKIKATQRNNARDASRQKKYQRESDGHQSTIDQLNSDLPPLETAVETAQAAFDDAQTARNNAEPGAKKAAIKDLSDARKNLRDAQRDLRANESALTVATNAKSRSDNEVQKFADRQTQNTQTIEDLKEELEGRRNIPKSTASLETMLDKTIDNLKEELTELERLDNRLFSINDKTNEEFDIPKPIRDIFGEVKDPILNLTATIHKQAHLIFNHKMLQAIEQTGVGDYLFTEPTTDPETGESFDIKIAADGSSSMSPLNGYYTSQRMYDVFADYNASNTVTGVLGHFGLLASTFKKNLTVLYHLVGLRNLGSAAMAYNLRHGDIAIALGSWMNWMALDGNLLGVGINRAIFKNKVYTDNNKMRGWMMAALGKINDQLDGWRQMDPNDPGIIPNMKKIVSAIIQTVIPDTDAFSAINTARNMTFGEDVWNTGDKEMEAEYLEAQRLGLIDEDFTYGPWQDALKVFRSKDHSDLEKFEKEGQSLPKRYWQKVDNFSINRYRSSDNAGRYLRYRVERAQYARILFNKPFDQLTDDQKEIVKKRGADIARRTYPTMSDIPPTMQSISKFPLLGAFTSFVVANTKSWVQTAGIAQNEISEGIKTGNTEMVLTGTKRAIGTALSSSIVTAMGKTMIDVALGIAAMGDEEKEAIDEFLPTYSRGGDVIAWRTDAGEFQYIALGPLLPDSVIQNIMSSGFKAMSGIGSKDSDKRFSDFSAAVGHLIQPFTTLDIATGKIAEAIYNTKELGTERPIYQVGNHSNNVSRRVGHVVGLQFNKDGNLLQRVELRPGLVIPGSVGMLHRLGMTATGTPTAYGTIYEAEAEAILWGTGTRMTKINMAESMKYIGGRKRAEIRDLKTGWRNFARGPGLSQLSDDDFWADSRVKNRIAQSQKGYVKIMESALDVDRTASLHGVSELEIEEWRDSWGRDENDVLYTGDIPPIEWDRPESRN